jgi:hypothetical protein
MIPFQEDFDTQFQTDQVRCLVFAPAQAFLAHSSVEALHVWVYGNSSGGSFLGHFVQSLEHQPDHRQVDHHLTTLG